MGRPHVSKYLVVSRQEVKQLTSDLSEAAVPFKLSVVQHVSVDPDDDAYLALAVEAKADCVVSGDRHLLSLRNYQGITSVTPAAFLALVEREVH